MAARAVSPLQRAMDAMSAANAEQLAMREERDLVGVKSGGVGKLLRCSPESIARTESELGGYMARQGCLSVSRVLSEPTIASLRRYIEAELETAKADVEAGRAEFEARFGGVNCRGPGMFGTRQDFFLPASAPEVRTALGEAFQSLAPLLRATVGMNGAIHEVSALPLLPWLPCALAALLPRGCARSSFASFVRFPLLARAASDRQLRLMPPASILPCKNSPSQSSTTPLSCHCRALPCGLLPWQVSSLVADPGAPRQCVHADTIVLPCPQYPDATMAPLLTFFVALQVLPPARVSRLPLPGPSRFRARCGRGVRSCRAALVPVA